MSSLLFEITSYDTPGYLQVQTERELGHWLSVALKDLNIQFHKVYISFSTNRRIVVYFPEIENVVPSKTVRKKGPKTTAPRHIISNFECANNISITDCEILDTDKGSYYFYNYSLQSRPLQEVLPDLIITEVLNKVAFKRSMFWNDTKIKWSRPITNLILMLDDKIIPFNFAGVSSSNQVQGHMFRANNTRLLAHAQDYFKVITELEIVLPFDQGWSTTLSGRTTGEYHSNSVHLNDKYQPLYDNLRTTRRCIVNVELRKFVSEHGLNWQYITDDNFSLDLLYLTECPVVLFGEIPSKYLDLPPELLSDTMAKNQRYINFYNLDGSISKHFAIVSSIQAKDKDNATEIIKGNQKVLNARLEDALFLYNLDLQEDWTQNVTKLKTVNFFEGLGSLFDKQERLQQLAFKAFPDDDMSKICRLCKVDLTSKVVAEFPALQGIMGYYYVKRSDPTISEAEALAIKEQYCCVDHEGRVTISLLGAKLAVLDRLDTLISFFSIGRIPTSSKDPFALRRAVLEIIKVCEQRAIDIDFSKFIDAKLTEFIKDRAVVYFSRMWTGNLTLIKAILYPEYPEYYIPPENHGRLNLSMISAKMYALGRAKIYVYVANKLPFTCKRVTNILKSAVDKGMSISLEVNVDLFRHDCEPLILSGLRRLHRELQTLYDTTNMSQRQDKYFGYIKELHKLAPTIDEFLDSVLIIDPAKPERSQNRLNLLYSFLQACYEIGDFTQME